MKRKSNIKLWLEATGIVVGKGVAELLVGIVLSVILVAGVCAVCLLIWLLFQAIFWIFGDGWFIALGDWFANGGVNTVLIGLAVCAIGCLLVLVGVEIRDMKKKLEKGDEEDEELVDGD